ncbi:tandem-95 repeat protein [Bradyrhizobium sp. WSM1743]|uniref:tandem-95 repeat protein n=1 Tax=Bradyrhizobium sp. WSM1743 TaxID=318996 RepID=UPI0003F6EDBC|nr:tandem-95 repeat protein [Bradyrhizobium sp. WSM1743]
MPLSDVSSPEDTAVSYTIPTGRFTDVDGNRLTYSATLADGSPLPSWLTLTGNKFAGTPPLNFNGAIDILVTASDGSLSASDVFTLTITPKNDAPVLSVPLPDVSSPEDTPLAIAIPPGSFTDVDGDTLTYTATLSTGAALPSWLSFDGTTFTGTPPANYNGTISIKVTARDGALSASDIFALTITPVNDAPVVSVPLSDVISAEDAAVSYTIPAGRFTDVDGNTLTYTATLADGSPLPSWLTLTGTRFAGTPPLNFNGAIDILVTASDGLLTASDVFTLTITPVNDKPVAANDGPFSLTHGDTLAIARASLLANDTDIDGDNLTIVSVGTAPKGTVVIDAQGVSYTPDFGYEGADSFTYTISDGLATATATVSLTISNAFEGWVTGPPMPIR